MNSDRLRILISWMLMSGGLALVCVNGDVLGLVVLGAGVLVRSTCLEETSMRDWPPFWRTALSVGALAVAHLPTDFPIGSPFWPGQILPVMSWMLRGALIAVVLVIEWRTFQRVGGQAATQPPRIAP